MAAKPGKTKAQYRADAYVMLDVTPEEVSASPRIEHLFKAIGGNKAVIEFLSGSEDPEARAILQMHARLSQRQAAAIPFEALCVAANIPVKKMFGVISQEVMEQSSKATQLLSKASHPKVVKATIDMALTPLGDKDRKMLHQAEGFVPIPRTAVTHFHGNVDARMQTANVAVLPPVEDGVRRLSDRFNSNMETPLLLPAEEVDEDDQMDCTQE